MPKPPRYHLGGVRREQWIANRIQLLLTRIQRDAKELLELDPPNYARVLVLADEDHQLLQGVVGDASDALDGEMDVCAADKDRKSYDVLREQAARINALLGRIA